MARRLTDNWAVGINRSRNVPAPGTPSLSSAQSRAQQDFQSAYQGLVSQYQPATPKFRDIPTFSASYFMPSDTLKQIQNVLSTSPTYNKKQLQQRAKTQTQLLTNPQIETLRQQINAFKSLIPETREGMREGYVESQQQLQGSMKEMLQQALEEARIQGGLRPGVAQALQERTREHGRPMMDALRADYDAQQEQVLGALETQKENAQNLLNTIQKSKKNMTKENYNALRDQAIKQFRAAQQAQAQILQGVAQIEAGARDSSAKFQQQAAAAYNEFQQAKADQANQFMQQMISAQLPALQEQMQQSIASAQTGNLNQWRDYIFSASTRTAADAMRRLQDNRQAIEQSIGTDGFMALQQEIQGLGPGWTNPGYMAPYTPTQFTSTPSTGTGLSDYPWAAGRVRSLVPTISNPIALLLRR